MSVAEFDLSAHLAATIRLEPDSPALEFHGHWHPWSYVHRRLTTSFAVLESLPAALADGYQDVHLLERSR